MLSPHGGLPISESILQLLLSNKPLINPPFLYNSRKSLVMPSDAAKRMYEALLVEVNNGLVGKITFKMNTTILRTVC
jgi:hypothetical protein